MKRCARENRLTPFLLGDLPETDAAEFRRHLAQCAACQNLARELEPVLTTLRAALAHDANADLHLDSSRREKLLAVPPRNPWLGYVISKEKRLVHWAAQSRPWLVQAACLLIIVAILAAALMPAITCSTDAARSTAAARAARLHAAAAASALESSEPPPAPVLDKPEEPEAMGCADEPVGGSGSQSEGIRFGSSERNLADKGFEISTAVKSRLIMKGLYSSRTAGGREGALGKWGSGDDEESDSLGVSDEMPTEPIGGSGAQTEGIGLGTGDPDLESKGFTISAEVKEKLRMKALDAKNTPAARKAALDKQKRAGDKYNGAAALTPAASPVAAESESLGVSDKDIGGMIGGGVMMEDQPVDINQPLPASAVRAKELQGHFTEKVGALAAATPSAASAPGGTINGYTYGFSGTYSGQPSSDAARKPKPPRAKAQSLNPFVATTENKFSTFGIDVSTASYTLTRQALRAGRLPDPEMVRTEAMVNSFDFGDLAPEKAMFRIYLEGAPSPFGAPGLTLLRIGVKGKHFGREEQRASVLTFLIDTSGSMAQPDRIGRARLALKLLLDQLAPADRVQIVAFDNHARFVLGPTPATEKARILAAFDQLQCNGSTNLEDGMRQAYQQAAHAFRPGAENRILLISDGVANLGSDSAPDILKQVENFRHQGISFSVYGVGQGSYDDAMLQDLANKGDGVYRFLDSDEEVRRAFVDDLAATLNTIATDVKIQVEWSPEAVKRFRQLGYESRALTAEQFRDDAVTAGGVGSGQAVTALYELDLTPGIKRVPLGTVRVRYRRADTHAIEEIEQPITAECITAGIQNTRSQFRLAVGAAAFAEMLRGSPYVAGHKYGDVAEMLRPVALDLSLDPRVKELLSLVEAADAASR